MSKHELLAMVTMTPFVAANPPENRFLPNPGTIVTGRRTEGLEP